jgi:hypothetical protein
MPAKKPARRTQQSTVPKALKVEVFVSRGDLTIKTETTAGELVAVTRFLIATVRQMAAEAPDMLPHVETVPGETLGYDWTEELDASVTVKPVGFR